MRLARFLPASVSACIICFAAAACARADTIYVQGTSLERVTIQDLTNGQLTFAGATGNISGRAMGKVLKIHVDGEDALNDAEDAFATYRFADSIDGYMTTFRSTTKDWLKEYVSGRLIDAAGKTNRFDAASLAYIAMLQRDPSTAARQRPAMPDSTSTYLDTAIDQTNDALKSTKVTDEQRIALLGFKVDLYHAKKDAKGADQAAEQLDEVLAKDPNNPAAIVAIARRKIQAANQSLEAKKYQEAIATIESNKTSFTDPAQQADALYTLAEAHMGLIGEAKNATALKDAALAYMRVVANFKDFPGKPHVADSLLKTGKIEEQLNEPDIAAKVYQQVVDQFPDDPAAASAKQNIARLGPPKMN